MDRVSSEDGNICVHNRHIYEVLGCKFALLMLKLGSLMNDPHQRLGVSLPLDFIISYLKEQFYEDYYLGTLPHSYIDTRIYSRHILQGVY